MTRLRACLAAAVLTVLVFAPSTSFEFLPAWDDGYILGNTAIRGLDAEHLGAIFSLSRNEASLRYQPLNYLLWAVNYRIGGLNPLDYHLSSVLLHGLNAGLLCTLLCALLGGDERRTVPAVLAATLLWSLHPLRVEAVSWAVARGHVLALTFLLLAALAVLRAARGSLGWRAASVALAVCAILSYPAAIGGCAALVLLDLDVLRRTPPVRWLGDRVARRALLVRIPYLAVALLGALAAAATRYGGRGPWDKPPELGALNVLGQLLRAAYCWDSYLWRHWWPFDLSPFYLTLINRPPLHWSFFAHALVLAALTAVAWRRRSAGALVLWAGYLLLAFPFTGFSEALFVANDRYTYVPGVCWSIIAAWALTRGGAQRARLGAMVIVVFLLAAGAATAQARWRDEPALFEHMAALLRGDPYESMADWRLGAAYLRRGDQVRGVAALDRAILLVPGEPTARGIRGQYRLGLGDLTGAQDDLERSIQGKPRVELYLSLAELKMRRKDWVGARTDCEKALQLSPSHPAALAVLERLRR